MADETHKPPPLPGELPVLPLLKTVVFPLTLQPLAVNRPVSVESVNRALASDRMLLFVMQEGEETDPQPEHLKRVGTVGLIRQMAKGPAATHIIVEGVARARIEEASRTGAVLKARIRAIPEQIERTLEVEAYHRRLNDLIERALSQATGFSQELRGIVMNITDPLRLAYLIASMLDMKADDKQRFLEIDSLIVKLQAIADALAREVELLELKGKIESQAEKEMSQAQRQYFLRQQLKAIQEELGEAEGGETKELRTRVEDAKLPENVASVAFREIDRLERMTPASPEYQMIRTYLDWILDIPWNVTTDDRLDPVEARRVLDEDHYDLDKVKERIVEYLAVLKLKGDMKGPILCFAGPPGVGKTSLGQSIARAMSRKFVRISLGGVRDEAEIRGHRRTYIGALPGRIVQALKQAGSVNPVFMLDEIDKVSAGFQGDPAAALLEVLDPAQNNTFRDHYLEVTLDLSRVLFITTANHLGPVHPALLDRMEVITLSGYTEEEKAHIARQYLIPRQLREHGLQPGAVAFTDAALSRIISEYTRESGVRNLERQIGTIARKVAARVAMTQTPPAPPTPAAAPEPPPPGTPPFDHAQGAPSGSRGTPSTAPLLPAAPTIAEPVAHIDAAQIAEYLGVPRFRREVEFRTSRPGVATGVAWTETGGDVLFIEASLIPGGKENIVLTGQLGNVMQESAKAAVSHIRAAARELHIPPDFLEHHDLHVHVPAGAIPKDGPSAGVTMATAILSAVRNEPVRQDVAMTGEITLSGLVLPVGGIREKALAARRQGLKTFILPERNSPDLADLPEEVRHDMDFVPVSTLEEVLKVALPVAEETLQRRT
ncbi:MAG: endopeptidase La [Acidobacteria bacterium]|nr:endopeptidase La [Acidobacteriota bacterium]